LDPTNTEAYVSFFFLEKNAHPDLQKLFKTAKRVHDKILLEKAETGNFDLVQVHPNYSDILTDGEVLFKKESNEDTAKKHIAILRFLKDNSKLKLPYCELCKSNNGNYYVKLQLAKNIANGKSEREFSACTLEDMTTLYKAEVNRKKEPTEKEMSEFRKKKLKQAIDAMIEFSSAGKEKESFARYGLDIPKYDYQETLEEKVFKRLNLDKQLKERAKRVAIGLTKQNRILSHCDFHCGNILAIENEQMVIIDPISTSYANRFFDLAYLLEQNELNLSKEEKSDLIDYFVGELEKNRESIQNPQQIYDLNAAFVNLRIAGAYSRESKELGKESSAKYAEIYIQQAKNALERLSNSNML
jgi:thiamine kinase-like enzyme